MPDRPRQRTSLHLTDASRMRVMAHPTRLRLLGLLRSGGAQTAALLGDQVDEAPGTVSYHLSKLAAAGLIEEAPDQGSDGRQRWWRAAHDSMHWEDADLLDDPAAIAASRTLEYSISQAYAQAHDRFVEARSTLPPEWVAASTSSDSNLRLTVDELATLRAELLALSDKWQDLSDSRDGSDPGGVEGVTLVVQAYRSV